MPVVEYVHRSAEPRVAVVSFRRLEPMKSRSGPFQFEDLIAHIDAVDIVAPTVSMAETAWLRKLRGAARRLGVRKTSLASSVPHLDREYDLLFMVCESAPDLLALGPLDPWLRRCRKVVCYVGEMWPAQRPAKGTTVAARLAEFDHIVLSSYGSTEFLSDLTGRPVTYLPYPVDSLAFCPYPEPPERCIDVYSMGRRSESTHQAFKELAANRKLFYLYDSAGNGVVDHNEHRHLLAQLITRTKYFVAYPGKIDLPELLQGQEELATRHFEGAAAGAVMIGRAPDTPMFAKYFGYEGAVVHMPYGTDDVASVYDALESDPQTVERIRRANVAKSLSIHDGAYRWQEVLASVGMKPLPQLDARTRRMRELAATISGPARPPAATPRTNESSGGH